VTAPAQSSNSSVLIPKHDLGMIISRLRQLGFRTVGPRMVDGAMVYGDVASADDLPQGYVDSQDGGYYRLERDEQAGTFDFVVGPDSLKNFVFPPRDTVLRADRNDDTWEMTPPETPSERIAVVGVRSCDLHALAISDRVFLEGPYVDPAYQARRNNLFLVAVNCRRSAATCFCHSMNTGPAVGGGFDLALTELDDSFVVEAGSEGGEQFLADAGWAPCPAETLQQARAQSARLEADMRARTEVTAAAGDTHRQRSLDTHDIRDLLLDNLEHARWDEVGDRCLACANCTMVCPTCFCSTVEEVTDLSGDHVSRERSWSSCFTSEHSYMSSGTVRKSTGSRYRQWLTHKLASWHDQFDTSGCTGCGRCITWCPVAIDLTEEVAAIRG
jgi:sulfhydrogenase subunit beta (sulfur reductase)